MLQMLRLTKLKESRDQMTPETYLQLCGTHADLMRLGEFWKGRKTKFSMATTDRMRSSPSGSPDDR